LPTKKQVTYVGAQVPGVRGAGVWHGQASQPPPRSGQQDCHRGPGAGRCQVGTSCVF